MGYQSAGHGKRADGFAGWFELLGCKVLNETRTPLINFRVGEKRGTRGERRVEF